MQFCHFLTNLFVYDIISVLTIVTLQAYHYSIGLLPLFKLDESFIKLRTSQESNTLVLKASAHSYNRIIFIFLSAPMTLRSSHPEVFCKKGVLKNFVKFIAKHLCQSLFFNKILGLRSVTLLRKVSGTGVFMRIL